MYQVPGADGDAFVFRYQVVPLWQLDARQMQAQLGPAAAPFCAAMRGADEGTATDVAGAISASTADWPAYGASSNARFHSRS